MTGARLLFALNGLIILSLLFLILKKRTNKYNALLAVLLLAGSNIFLDRGFRVRSDLLLSSLSLFTLYLSLNVKDSKDLKNFLFPLLIFLSLLLLISPKGVYWLLFSIPLILHSLKVHSIPLNTIFKSRAFFITSFTLMTSILLLSLALKDPFYLKAMGEALKFYSSDLKYSFMQHNYLNSLIYFSHLPVFISKNPLLVLIISLKILFIFCTLWVRKTKPDLADLSFLLLLAVLFFSSSAKIVFYRIPYALFLSFVF